MPGLLLALAALTSSTSSAGVPLEDVAEAPAVARRSRSSSVSASLARVFGAIPLVVVAERLEAAMGDGVFVATGGVIVERDGLVLRADRVTFDEGRRSAIAEGHVAIADARGVLFCSRVELQLPELAFGVRSAELRVKGGFQPEVAARLDLERLRSFGRDRLILEADALERTGPGPGGERRYLVEGGSFTSCDCGAGEAPTWRIEAGSASVDLESGAWLSWPVFYLKGLPVLALPAFYVPLGQRRTGLLAPRGGYSTITGLRLSQPLFVTLGEAWDTTLEAGVLSDRGVSGAAEVRWAPSTESRGVARATFLLDAGEPDGEGGYSWGGSGSIARYSLSARHTSALLGGGLAADLNLAGDPAYVAELAPAFLERQAELAASRITWSRMFDERVRVAAGLALLQDLRARTYPGAELRRISLFSSSLPGPGEVRQRAAELRLDALPHPITRGAPLFGEARLALAAFAAPSPEVARFARVDLRPALSLPLPFFDVLLLEPAIAARFTAWTGRAEHEERSAVRFATIARTVLSAEVGRRFDTVVHHVRPSLEHVLIPWVERRGAEGLGANDEVELLRPISQVRARLSSELTDARSGARVFAVDAWLGRDLGLGATEGQGTSALVATSQLRLDRALAGWSLRLDLRTALGLDAAELIELLAGATVSSPSGAALSAVYREVGAEVPVHSMIAAEELVWSGAVETGGYVPPSDPRVTTASALPWTAHRGLVLAAQLSEALPASLGRITVSTRVALAFDREGARPPILYGPETVRSTESSLRWDSSCECLGIGAVVTTARDRPGIELAAVLVELGELGVTRGW